jgi:hypothetical protein
VRINGLPLEDDRARQDEESDLRSGDALLRDSVGLRQLAQQQRAHARPDGASYRQREERRWESGERECADDR